MQPLIVLSYVFGWDMETILDIFSILTISTTITTLIAAFGLVLLTFLRR